ncbi:MAG: outer membrane beta-barrel protein, partial [Ginsengibacter sp.]
HAVRKAFNDNLDVDIRLINELYGNGQIENYGARTDGGLIVPNVFTLSNSVNAIQNFRSYNYNTPNNKVIGLGGIANIGWKDYLNLELTARQDWLYSLTYPSGVPGSNNYSVFYPSANLSWSFSEMWEDKMPQWLSFGKLRASIAWVGDGTDPYATSFGSYNQGTVLDRNGNSVVIANLNNANVLPNLNLKPEIQRSIELGTNLAFLNNRINFDLAWYKTNTFNQILTIPGIMETGYANRRINAGNIQNQGLEMELKVTPLKTKNLSWDVSFNYSRNRGKIIKFYPGIKEYAMMGDYDGAGVYAYEGGAFGVLTANYSDGSWREHDPKTGLPIIKVGDRAIDTDPSRKTDFQEYVWVNEKFNPEKNPRHNIGNVEPRFLAGFNTSLRWKQFSLYAQIDSRFGGWIYSESYSYGMGRGNLLESLKFRDKEHGGVERIDSYTGNVVYNGAIPDAIFAEGEKSPVTGANIGGMTFKEAYDKKLVEPWYASSFNINTYGWGTNFDAGAASEMSWIMLREITLGYQLPKNITDKINFKGAGLRFTARNIGYLYNSLNGEQNPASLQSNDPFIPVITGAVPFARNYAVSLNLNF